MLKLLSLVFVLSIFVTGCSTTSNGLTLGFRGSPAWHENATKEDMEVVWNDTSLEKLKKKFNSDRDYLVYKQSIFNEVERRGMNASEFLLGDQSLTYLRENWVRSYNNPTTRHFIAVELTRRNLNPDLFYNANADNVMRKNVAIKARESSDNTKKFIESISKALGDYSKQSTSIATGQQTESPSRVPTSYQRVGNTVFGSDGSSCTKVGNSVFCN